MPRESSLNQLAEIGREQAGYVTTGQARRRGKKSEDLARLARRGDLRRAAHGVYALPGSFAGPREDLIVSWLRLTGDRLPWEPTDPAAVVSHVSAAGIHGFGTFLTSTPTFTVFRRRFQPSDGSIHLYTASLDPSEWKWVVLPEGIAVPVTTAARTIVDLAYGGEEREHVLDALSDAREAGLVDDASIEQAIARRQARRGRGTVGWLREAALRRS